MCRRAMLSTIMLVFVASTCGGSAIRPLGDAVGTHRVDPLTLVGPRSWLDGWPAEVEGGFIHVVVEIPTGGTDKWEVSKPDGKMRWEVVDGRPRVVQYVGYPGNYGMVPRTVLDAAAGGDGDPLDVLVLGPPRGRGAVMKVRPIGVLRLLDRGEQDDKILAVDPDGPFATVENLSSLQERFPGVRLIVETFFSSYKGAAKTKLLGWAPPAEAWEIIRLASATFQKKMAR